MDQRDVLELRKVLASGEAMLFTGAGFSAAAHDNSGRGVPTSEEITREIWNICFPGEHQDASTLTDLFHHAAAHHPKQLERLLRDRLCVCARDLPPFYQRWFAVPWRRAWTLNVDDIEHAAAERFQLPREVVSYSALSTQFSPQLLDTKALAFIHLNGDVHDGIRHVTFSTTQYGDRLVRHDPWYQQFVEDLVRHPFVIVGTRLEEAPFWRNLHESFGYDGDLHMEAHNAYIVSPDLTRARRALLEDLGIHWIPLSAEQFSEQVLEAGPTSGDHVVPHPPSGLS